MHHEHVTNGDTPDPTTGGAWGVVMRGAAKPRASVRLTELTRIAAGALLAFDSLDDEAKAEAMAEARRLEPTVWVPRSQTPLT